MENVVILCDHLEYFTAIWYNLRPIGIVCGNLVDFYVLVCLDQEKSGNPGVDHKLGTRLLLFRRYKIFSFVYGSHFHNKYILSLFYLYPVHTYMYMMRC
jgi:hypothetical protein